MCCDLNDNTITSENRLYLKQSLGSATFLHAHNCQVVERSPYPSIMDLGASLRIGFFFYRRFSSDSG